MPARPLNVSSLSRIMAASYNTILVPAVEREAIVAAIGDSLHQLGCRIVYREEPSSCGDGFQYPSTQMVFVGVSQGSSWVPLSSWGDGLGCEWPEWYRRNPLAMALSSSLGPVAYLFSYNAGLVAGYSIFRDGQQVEAQSLPDEQETLLGEFTPTCTPPVLPSLLAELLGDVKFDFTKFMRGFPDLEVGVAALAARLGMSVHLIEPLDIQDGDGALVVKAGQYESVGLPGWFALYYEKQRHNPPMQRTGRGTI